MMRKQTKILNRALIHDNQILLTGRANQLLQKPNLETPDLYEPPLDMFGADAVERWFTEKEVSEIVEFTNKLGIAS